MLDGLTTEQRNPDSERIDELSSLEIVRIINVADQVIAEAVGKEANAIASAVDRITEAFVNGGRLIYLGAGTSGRLGVLDASECPPTFNTDPSQVVGLIAGGYSALVKSIEGAEDAPEGGRQDLEEAELTNQDVVVGIATSGRTPYVLGALQYANDLGCTTVSIACNKGSEIEAVSDIAICPVVGPEIVSGSTRMKAGTATKMILNSITTAAMIRLGKTYGNLMVDLRATNSKLRERSRRIVRTIADVDEETAQILLDRCDGEVKTAIVSSVRNVTAEIARAILKESKNHLRTAMIERP